MNAEKQRAVRLLIGGVTFLTLPAVTVASHPEHFRAGPARPLALLLPGQVLGIVLCGFGWARLRKAKRACPEQSWARFLGDDLIVAAIVLALVAVVVLLGDSLLPFFDELWAALHDFETVLHVVR